MTAFCRNCKHWQPFEEDQVLGFCRFNAPVTDVTKMQHADKGHTAYWPVTEDLDYCSKHQPWEHADKMIDQEHMDPEDAENDRV